MTIKIEAECDQCGKRESADRSGGYDKVSCIEHPVSWLMVQTYGPTGRKRWYCSRECVVEAASLEAL